MCRHTENVIRWPVERINVCWIRSCIIHFMSNYKNSVHGMHLKHVTRLFASPLFFFVLMFRFYSYRLKCMNVHQHWDKIQRETVLILKTLFFKCLKGNFMLFSKEIKSETGINDGCYVWMCVFVYSQKSFKWTLM